MAVEMQLLTWCDIHLQEKDEQVPAVAYTVAVAGNGTKPSPVTVDLCADCAGPLLTVQELVAAYGRKPDAASGRRARPQQARPVPVEPAAPARSAPAGGAAACSLCGQVSKNRHALADHTRRMHDGLLLGQVEGSIAEDGLTCLLCDPPATLKSRKAVAIHVGRVHGGA